MLIIDTAIDATKTSTLSFSYQGVINKVEALFYNNETDELVYGEGVFYTTQKEEYILQADALGNSSIPYYIRLRVYDNENNISVFSDKTLLYCRTTPSLTFDGISGAESITINTSSFSVSVNYNSVTAENELLNYYNINVYDYQNILVQSSEAFYGAGTEYTINNLENRQTYYVEAVGYTQHNMRIATPRITLQVVRNEESLYTKIIAENRYKNADIRVQSKIISIEGVPYIDDIRAENSDLTYIDALYDEAVDLLQDNVKVVFDDGFTLPSEFVGNLLIKQFNPQRTVFKMSDSVDIYNLHISTRTFSGQSEPSTYITMREITKSYVVESNHIVYGGGYLLLKFKRVNSHYTIEIEEITE